MSLQELRTIPEEDWRGLLLQYAPDHRALRDVCRQLAWISSAAACPDILRILSEFRDPEIDYALCLTLAAGNRQAAIERLVTVHPHYAADLVERLLGALERRCP